MIAQDWGAIVNAVHERDRNQCMNCHRSGGDVTLDVHHVVPRGRGGAHRLSNLLLLCRQCHDAAHGNAMAPRLRWFTNGQMSSDEFEVFRTMFDSFEIARFDDSENCWYIPLGDAQQLVGSGADSSEESSVANDDPTSLAAFM